MVGRTREHDPRQWALKTDFIVTTPGSTLDSQFITYNNTIQPSTPPETSIAPLILGPNTIEKTPPSGYHYPKGRTFMRVNDNRYRARCVYSIPFEPPLDDSTEVDFLRRIILPPDAYPEDGDYDFCTGRYRAKPIQGITPLVPGVPVCVDLHGRHEDSVTIAALFNLECLECYPEYPQIHSCLMKLWDITWAQNNGEPVKDGIPVYAMPGLQRNMRSGEPKPERPYDGSSSHASTRLEGNGRGFGVPASQSDISTSKEIRLLFLKSLNELYQLIAPLALSKEEYLVTTFRAVDLNVYSFGGLFPTGLTSVQLNNSSANAGGNLMEFIGAIQGAFHVDFHDDRCRWTMLVIFIRLPKGSDPGAFILARFGLYAKLELLPDSTCKIILWFKGNDLHSGVAPTVHPSVRQAALAQLAEQINAVDRINRVVYVCYPSEDLCHRKVPMMNYPSTINFSGPSSNHHWYDSQGCPALGSVIDCRTRLRWDADMEWWNQAVMRGEKPQFPSQETFIEERDEESGEFNLVAHTFPRPSFPFLEHGVLEYNPYDHQEFFASWRAAWVRLRTRSEQYYLSMTKYQYRWGQEQARLDFEENKAEYGVVVMTNLLQCTFEAPVQQNNTSLPSTTLPSYPAARVNPDRGKRKTSNDITSEHRSKQSRADKEQPDSSADRISHPLSPNAATPDIPRVLSIRRVFNPDGESELDDEESDEDEGTDDEQDMEDVLEVPSYDLSMIVNHDETDGILHFKVRWSGYGAEADSYLTQSQLSKAVDLVDEYWDRVDSVAHPTPNSRGHTALQKMFDHSDELARDIQSVQELCELSNTAVKSAGDLSGIIRCGHLLRQVSLQLNSDGDFDAGIINSAIPALAAVGVTLTRALSQLPAIQKVERFALNQALGRAYLFVYSWYTDYGPYFVRVLIASGIAGTINTLFPAYSAFISRLITSARALEQALGPRGMTYSKLQNSPQATLLTVTFPIETLSPFLPDIAAPLSLMWPKRSARGQVTLEKWLEEPLLEFLSEHFLLNRTQVIATIKHANNPNHVRGKDEWVVRGAFAEALVDVFDDDGILGLEAVHLAFNHPLPFFTQQRGIDVSRLANAIRADPEKTAAEIRIWLRCQQSLPSIQDHARRLSSAVHTVIQRITSVSVKGVRSTARKKKAKNKEVNFVGTPVDAGTPLAELIPYKEWPNFAFLSVMLREVLAFAQTKKCHVDYLHRILTCQDLKTGTERQSLNPDHYSPIRCSTDFQRLITQSMSPAPRRSYHPPFLTSMYGLSNILLRFATGQGYRTRDFLDGHLTRWFTASSDAISLFKTALSGNLMCSDGRCWGQYSRQLHVKEPKDADDRIPALFSSRVCDAWQEYWGHWSGKDHHTIPTHSLPPYKAVFRLLDKLNILGFGANSITRMQMANYFAIEGLCKPASAETMAEITTLNKKGALQGLLILGFNVRNGKLDAITLAFKCVYDFLDTYLSPHDKEVLGFGAIFVEHLLCKVTRWHNMLMQAKILAEVDRLLGEAKQAGENWPLAQPPPLYQTIDTAQLQEATVRRAYQELGNRVTHTLRVQLGDAAQVRRQRDETARFLMIAEQRRHLFDDDEQETLFSSLDSMLSALEDAISASEDIVQQEPLQLSHSVSSTNPGRPRIDIDPAILEASMQYRGFTHLAPVFDCSARTLRRRALEYGLADPCPPVYVQYEDPESGELLRFYKSSTGPMSALSNEELDAIVTQVLQIFPSFGRRMLNGHLLHLGHRVSRHRVRDSYERVTGAAPGLISRPVERRRYYVPGPNSLWHHDGQHGLIRWRFVIHAFVDGFSRMVMAIQVNNNNRARTVLDLFLDAVEEHGTPSRVRGDHGVENLGVAQYMEESYGVERGSYIWGRSVHNIRIERLWRDVTMGFGIKWYNFFHDLEAHHGLSHDNDAHIWLLHRLFHTAIDEDAMDWAGAWNSHSLQLRDRRDRSPRDIFFFGTLQEGLRGPPQSDEVSERIEEEVEDIDTYGVDWDELSDASLLRHFNEHNPDSYEDLDSWQSRRPPHLNLVEIPDFDCPFETDQELELFEWGLSQIPERYSRNMDSRVSLWNQALALAQFVVRESI
ncbi:hypothetical protein PQX77_014220 [Marasmius sp. AFHP31]|nr:hypothetical protein PQX77_014220 [Marasmius sp. AFHP31]